MGGRSASAREILDRHLARRGASFFADVHEAAGGGYPQQTVDALWTLVWRGLVTNDTFQALRAYTLAGVRRERARRAARRAPPAGYRSRLAAPAGAGGRWTLVEARRAAVGRARPTSTQWSAALAQQLLVRYGVVTRGVAASESSPAVSARSTTCCDTSRRPGESAAGTSWREWAPCSSPQPGALDPLRSSREPPEVPGVVTLAATDPANPWGALVEWPPLTDAPEGKRPARAAGAVVVLVDGEPAAWAPRGLRQVLAWLPEFEPDRSRLGAAAAAALAVLAAEAHGRGEGVLVEEVNGLAAGDHPLAGFLIEAGFVASSQGLQLPRRAPPVALPPEA